MIDFQKIKLVIWDLDDTFWQGTLSEEPVHTPDDHLILLNRLADIGIVSSICSKNDWSTAEQELQRLGVRNLFVFPSVSWEPKGQRIRQQIADMQLRPVNVLFLDDNPSNRSESMYCCPGLMAAGPEVIPQLMDFANSADRKDPSRQRLAQYHLLEEKHIQKESFSSNEDFLRTSGIRLTFGEDCRAHLDRIHELVWRSNQLNFTKVRSTREELAILFADPSVRCGYVSVEDRFGDYGLTGFYALKENRLLHFCFSCRTLGMGIEQYVYHHLGRPDLETVGEVLSDLTAEAPPSWINQAAEASSPGFRSIAGFSHRVLMKGPCDLFQIMPYIADKSMVDTEFTYVAPNGTTIESTGHTTHIVEALRLTEAQKQLVLTEVPFLHEGIYRDSIYKNGYRVVIISILSDANLGIYRRKDTGERFAFVEGFRPLTDPGNWDGYIRGEYSGSSVTFTRELLEDFSAKYEFIGINTPEQIAENLRYIKDHLPGDCTLAVMLGGELYYEKNTFPAYETRHLTHRAINSFLRAHAKEIGLELIDVNQYLADQGSFYDHFNHYIKPVYYALAGEIADLVSRQTGQQLRKTGKLKMIQVRVKELLAPHYHRIRSLLGI